jgi:hypothetical protein
MTDLRNQEASGVIMSSEIVGRKVTARGDAVKKAAQRLHELET